MTSLKVKIASSSFMLPNNVAWDASDYGVNWEFGEYNDWLNAVQSGQSGDVLCLVLFDEDIARDDVAPGSSSTVDAFGTVARLIRDRAKSIPDMKFVIGYYSEIGDDYVSMSGASNARYNAYFSVREVFKALREDCSNVYLLDLNPVFAKTGLENCFSKRNYYLARCRLSFLGIQTLRHALVRVLERFMHPAKKVLVLDCDNTLWGGVIGEDGIANITLGLDGVGKAFQDFQKEALRLNDRGILLCLNSKNNAKDVLEVFDQHEGMALKFENIVDHEINWRPKPENMRALAERLSLGLDSFVFWDDSEKERAEMRHYLPDVLTVEPSQSVFEWPTALRSLNAFCTQSVTKDDLHRTRTYRARKAFLEQADGAPDTGDFLKSIDMQGRAHEISTGNIARAAQMCEKTNQFNLRTIRHTQDDIMALAAITGSVSLIFQLTDIFGDHGLSALALVEPIGDGKFYFLDTFLLSCRVLGRRFETWCLWKVSQHVRALGAQGIVSEFRQTQRNKPAAGFLSNHGFIPYISGDISDVDAFIKRKPLSGDVMISFLDDTVFPNPGVISDETID